MRAMRALLVAGVVCAACSIGPPTSTRPADNGVFFDDFSHADKVALERGGWMVRSKPGHPGVEGAAWGPDSVSLIEDPQQPGNRLLRLSARTDGTPDGTAQAQVCHARKYYEGTYAARVRLTDQPVAGPDGDVIVQTFYAVSPLQFDFDPEYSEVDWEYLPNGGWGDPRTRLYAISWQTARIKPWKAYNQPHEVFRALDGWHVLMMTVAGGKTRFYLDGVQVAEHAGRSYPVVPMSLNFNLWFSPSGLLPDTKSERVYQQDVDWVFHARNRELSAAQVDAAVRAFRSNGTNHVDSVAPIQPPLPSSCEF